MDDTGESVAVQGTESIVRWPATSRTDHPSQSDGESHWAGVSERRSSTSSARSATICSRMSTLSQYDRCGAVPPVNSHKRRTLDVVIV